MLTRIKEVHEGFFKIFQPVVTVSTDKGSLAIPVVYARHSNREYVKKQMEKYPRIVMIDNTIGFSTEWRPNGETYVLGYDRDPDTNVIVGIHTGQDPIEMVFEYQVSAYLDNIAHKIDFMQWVIENFESTGGLNLVATNTNNLIVEDSATYSMTTQEYERTDGIFEYHLFFKLKPLLQLGKLEIIELVEILNIQLHQKDLH